MKEVKQLHPWKDLEFPLLSFSDKAKDIWTISDAVRGTQIFVGIGSGKSSSSGKNIAKAMLQNGFGGLVLCAKPDERDNWLQYAKETGREKSIKVISEHGKYRFNFLEYEMNRPDGGGKTRNLSTLFMNIYEMGQKGGSKGDERFWDTALKRMINRTIDLLKLSGENISIANMASIVNSYPRNSDFFHKANSGYFSNGQNKEEYQQFMDSSYCLSCLSTAVSKEFNEEDKIVFDIVWSYWGRDLPSLAEKTRSIITESFLGLAEPFLSGVLRKIFSTTTNITPEETHEGYIIILDFPEKEYLELGVYAQSIFKLLWQQSTQRRDVTPPCRPVFLWVDEAQLFLSEKHDMLFQSTARSSKACTVFISQNISNYYSVIGGSNPREQADSLLGNLSTKIFHCNNDYVTNKWAADTIGQDFRAMGGVNISGSEANHFNVFKKDKGGGTGFHTHEMLLHQVLPREFTTMKCGGHENNLEVEAVVTVAGKTWSNGNNYIRPIFRQDV